MSRLVRWIAMPLAVVLTWAGAVHAQSTDNPHGKSVGTCSTCHLPSGWKPVRIADSFRHAPATFPLEGAHQGATCTSCHTSLDFSKAAARCASCHEDVHRGELGVDCARCHTSRSFTDQVGLTRMHETTRFPLRGAHLTAPCASCHTPTAAGQPQYANRPSSCISCHRSDYDAAATPPHASAGFPTECSACHGDASWQGAPFDHDATSFPLTGAHQTATCTSCHADNVFAGKPTDCASCHRGDYDQTTAPPHAAAAFPTDCASCHTTAAWPGAPFDHNTTQFPLTGGHQAVACASCHGDGVYHGKATACVACHQADFDATTDPPHGAAGYATDCTTCHTTGTWQGATFDHDATQFPLTGSHQAVACASCHGDGVYHGKATACAACHQADFDATTSPPHVASGFPTECTTCHTTTDWHGAPFDHNATQFPLTGAHIPTPCSSCHGDGVYAGKATACEACHQADYDATTNPAHGAAGYSTDCASCHTTAAWQDANFDHNTTQFPLTGAHVATACSSCHGDGVYAGRSTACAACHQADYDGTTNPAHAAAGYSTDCTTCHTTTGWQGANFDHNTTNFPLTGAHVATACSSCHGNGVFAGTATACSACHQPDYDGTTDPPHAAAGFPTACATCHTTTAWPGAVFDHDATQFPLTGAHGAAPCSSCHADGVYAGKPTACASCHQPDYDGTTDPPHAAAGFPTACATCHTTTAWPGAVFDHNATSFPLTGAHLATACSSCHGDGVYHGKPTACIACHQVDYDGTTNPSHAAAGYSTDCASCHTTTAWPGAVFDHNATQFPLTGAHMAATCASCHADGVYAGKPTACAACHQADYDATTTPPHAAAGFPTACATCHTTTAWPGAVFNHNATQFPLTGAHLATACNSCHGDGVYHGKATACVACHQADYNGTTNPSHSAAGYSTDCASCHTTTAWPGATFDHNTTSFPLTGAHVAAPCASCHGDGVYAGKPTACAACHQADYNATTNPNHSAAGFPTDCASCHTTSTWNGATFDHDGMYFPIYSGAHRNRWSSCSECHTSASDYAVFTCTTCHGQSSTNSHHHGVSGYVYQSQACYSCHPRGRAG